MRKPLSCRVFSGLSVGGLLGDVVRYLSHRHINCECDLYLDHHSLGLGCWLMCWSPTHPRREASV